ncbi:MAG: DUF3021 family protein [Lachnospiraceae bacterium]|nr:DUF3021 family protein [Lachnospiraceae bacterium]
MNKKNTVWDYLTHIMVVWGISLLSISVFAFLFGENGKGYSSIFSLGSEGISLATLAQFFLLAVMITTLRWVFFTDGLIKRLPIAARCIWMVAGVILTVGVLAAVCGWFPVNQVMPWLMFLICFFVCAAISVAVSVRKEKNDNQKMQEALERLKGEEAK